MPAIPLCVVEEHHEAFFVWRWAVANGVIPDSGNLLLHVDQHADVGSPRLRRPLPPLSASLDEAYRFTYDELCCFEFIVPAIYQRLIDHVIWVQWRPTQTANQLVLVRPGNDTATAFMLDARNVEPDTPLPQLPASFPGGAARYRLQPPDAPLGVAGSVILDIDLDFASCEDAANQVERLAVTREAYESFKTDRYHFLRITQGSRIALVEEDGGYYVYLRRFDERAPTPLRVDEAEILRRLDVLTARLREDDVRPALVVIARSRFSGFTAADQWAFIESALVERLRTLYDLDVFTVDTLARRLGLAEAWPGVPR